jgi:hypothetical protein
MTLRIVFPAPPRSRISSTRSPRRVQERELLNPRRPPARACPPRRGGLGSPRASAPTIRRPPGREASPTAHPPSAAAKKPRGNRYQNGTLERWDAGQQRWLPIAQDGAGDTEAPGNGPYDGLSPSIQQRLLRDQFDAAGGSDSAAPATRFSPPTKTNSSNQLRPTVLSTCAATGRSSPFTNCVAA